MSSPPPYWICYKDTHACLLANPLSIFAEQFGSPLKQLCNCQRRMLEGLMQDYPSNLSLHSSFPRQNFAYHLQCNLKLMIVNNIKFTRKEDGNRNWPLPASEYRCLTAMHFWIIEALSSAIPEPLLAKTTEIHVLPLHYWHHCTRYWLFFFFANW